MIINIPISRGLISKRLQLARSATRACLFIALLGLTACDSFNRKAPATEPVAEVEPEPIEPSHLALSSVSDRDIRFAQTALKQLGYRLGTVDGIWGDRSATAMRSFEQSRDLLSASGALSELNLYALSKATKVRKSEIESSITKPAGLNAKLDDSVPLSKSPQLIIVDQNYDVLAKANPYSKVLTSLQSGNGIYVVAVQDGWYQIESLSGFKGYIREN